MVQLNLKTLSNNYLCHWSWFWICFRKSSDRGDHTSYSEKYQVHIYGSFAYKVACADDKFSKPVVLYRGKNAINRFIKAILEEMRYSKKVLKRILIRI